MHAHARARACARSHAHRAARRRRRAAPWKGAHIAGARRGAGGRLRSAADGPVSEGSRGFVSSSLFHCMQPRAGRPPPGAFASHQGHFPKILLHLQIPFRPHPFVHGRATQLAQARDCPPPLGHLQLACSNNKLACNQLSAACHQAAGVTAYPLSFPSSPQVSSHYTRTQRHPCSRGRTTILSYTTACAAGESIQPPPAWLTAATLQSEDSLACRCSPPMTARARCKNKHHTNSRPPTAPRLLGSWRQRRLHFQHDATQHAVPAALLNL